MSTTKAVITKLETMEMKVGMMDIMKLETMKVMKLMMKEMTTMV